MVSNNKNMKADLFEARAHQSIFPYDPTSDTLAALGVQGEQACGLINAITGAKANAPYLRTLLEKWPEVATDLESKTPENILQTLLEDATAQDLASLNIALRHAKQKIHLLCALCDLAGVWDWDKVCRSLSDFADKAMLELIKAVAVDMEFTGNEDNPVPGLFVLAVGKYGARELNYSSDIDLIVFYDPERIVLPNPARAEKTLIRFVRKVMRGFDDVSEHGYVFRTDLRLRPDPRATTVAVSTRTAERYYESLGQNWERAAMIKARIVGGDKDAGADFIGSVLTPFIWRRSLDYHAIDDVHSIKRQIQGNATPETIKAAGHDVKLGVGGIREIEFYVQTQQLILGGRNPELRVMRTIEGLQALAEAGYTEPRTAAYLQDAYGVLRDVEHRIQMHCDEQTHIWPTDIMQRTQLCGLSGTQDRTEYEEELREWFLGVHGHYQDLFAEGEDLATDKGSLVFTGVSPEAITLQTFKDYGFERGPEVWRIIADWLGGRIPATRSERAREVLTRLAPRIIEACGATGAPDEAFFSFAEFASHLRAGVTLFSLFVNQPAALTSLIEMLGMVPTLGRELAARPALIDALTDPAFFTTAMHTDPDEYARHIPQDADFEMAMNIVRRAVKEDQFMFTARFLKRHNANRAGQILADIADASITALLPFAAREVGRTQDKIPADYAIVGLGKLGGRELSLRSDLDVMLVYDDGAAQKNSGGEIDKRIYNKLTKRVITALSAVTAEGSLYEVDMALRPSGRAGPLAVSLSAFEKYYREDAWTWEFMALSRARVIAASSSEFQGKLETKIAQTLLEKDYQDNLAVDVLDMQQRLYREKPGFGLWDVKNIPGGLRDVEFIAQYLMLKHQPKQVPQNTTAMLELAIASDWIAKDIGAELINSNKLYHDIIQVMAFTKPGKFDPMNVPQSVLSLLLDTTGQQSFADLQRRYSEACARIKDLSSNIIQD